VSGSSGCSDLHLSSSSLRVLRHGEVYVLPFEAKNLNATHPSAKSYRHDQSYVGFRPTRACRSSEYRKRSGRSILKWLMWSSRLIQLTLRPRVCAETMSTLRLRFRLPGLPRHFRLLLPSDRSMISRRAGTFLSKPFHKAPRRVSSVEFSAIVEGSPKDCRFVRDGGLQVRQPARISTTTVVIFCAQYGSVVFARSN